MLVYCVISTQLYIAKSRIIKLILHFAGLMNGWDHSLKIGVMGKFGWSSVTIR